MSLWLIRHARPWVEEGVCYGSSNIAADPQATQLAALALAQVLPQQTRVAYSPLQRCEQLKQSLYGLRPDLTFKVDARLVEMDFGCWEGQRWNALPPAELAAWTANFAHHPCGGGGESVQQVMARVASAWDEACDPAGQRGQPTAWITHAGVIRAATLLAQGQRHITRADQWPREAPVFGGWCTLPFPPLLP